MQAFKMINQISELKINEFLAFTKKSKMDKITRNEEDKLSIYITVLCKAKQILEISPLLALQ